MKTYQDSPELIAYSTFRANWRTAYKLLSSEIHGQKHEVKDLWRNDKPTRAGYLQSTLAGNRKIACEMMEQLDLEKAKWKEQLAAETVSLIPQQEAAA